MRKSVHISWLIGWSGLGVIAGVGACVFLSSEIFNDLFWPSLALSGGLVCLVKSIKLCLPVVFLCGACVGLWRGSQIKIDLLSYKPFYGQIVLLQGRVSQDASIGDKGDQKLNLADVRINQIPLKGEVWASVGKSDIKRGDIVTLKGGLNEGFGNLTAAMYRSQIVTIERPHPGDIARRVRDWFGLGVRAAIPEPQASLGLGYLVGQKAALPKELEDNIKIVGLTHAVVASGYNLTVLVLFSRRLFMRISKYVATLSSIILVVSFMLITGLSPSMSRAGLVACTGLIVWYYGRAMHPFVLLTVAASLTVLINPSYLWGDLGWYLSFGSFIGVIVLAPLVHQFFWGSQKPSMIRQLIVDTLSAQIVTLPIIQYSFGLYSVYALPANIMVLPLIPLAMMATFVAGFVGLVNSSLAPIASFPATMVLSYSTGVIKRWANLPNSQIPLQFNLEVMIASYILIAALIAVLIWRTKYDFRSSDSHDKH